MRRPALLATLLPALAALVLAGAPAAPAAADGPTIALDEVTTPGHVTGTVTGVPEGTAYVRFRLNKSAVQSANVPVVDGRAGFDLPTWGYGDSSVDVAGCTGSTGSTCGQEALAESPVFTPQDTPASVTWSDLTLAQGQTLTATVSDPRGGGALQALWDPADDRSDVLTWLGRADDRSVDTTVTVGTGRGVLRLFRCVRQDRYAPCQQQGGEVAVERDTTVTTYAAVTPATVGPQSGTVSTQLNVSDPGTWTVDWTLRDPSGTAAGSGTLTRTVASSGWTIAWPVPLSGPLTAGTYVVEGTASRASDAGDPFTSTFSTTFAVDATAPVAATGNPSSSSVFPASDGYLDSVDVPVTVTDERGGAVDLAVEVRDAQGGRVAGEALADRAAGSSTWTWDGRDDDGTVVPAGTYTVHARATDQLGNVGAWSSGTPVVVDTRAMVAHTWSRSISAYGSMVARSVGRCSLLRLPSSHGWAYSTGLESGVRCRTTDAAANRVTTTHAITLPTLTGERARWTTMTLSGYAGAATSRTSSTATARYLMAGGSTALPRTWYSTVLHRALPALAVAGAQRPDGSVRFAVDTAGANRYDVHSFTLKATYEVLEQPSGAPAS